MLLLIYRIKKKNSWSIVYVLFKLKIKNSKDLSNPDIDLNKGQYCNQCKKKYEMFKSWCHVAWKCTV